MSGRFVPSEERTVKVKELADRYLITDEYGEILADRFGFSSRDSAIEWAERQGYYVRNKDE